MIRQSFLYGYEITSNNYLLNFRELGDTADRVAIIPYNTYSPFSLASIIEGELNDKGTSTYTVTFDGLTRTFTISSLVTFSLLPSSTTSSAYNVIGFSTDQAGLMAYTGDETGSLFKPQLPLFSLTDFDEQIMDVNGAVSIATSGYMRSTALGRISKMNCDIRYITNKDTGSSPVENNSSALQEAKDFLNYAINKKRIVFFKDDSDRINFKECVLRKTSSSSLGLGYVFKEMININLPEFYEVSGLEFWEV